MIDLFRFDVHCQINIQLYLSIYFEYSYWKIIGGLANDIL